MNGIIISLIFLIVVSMVLPASAIMYASGQSTDNSGSSSTGSSPTTDNSGSSTTGGGSTTTTTDNSGSSSTGGSTTTADNSATLPTTSTASNNTGNIADLANSILAVHNSERGAVGVPPLVWNETLAAGAKTWAEHLATTGEFAHSTCCGAFRDYGENIAGFYPDEGMTKAQAGWIAEKNHYDGGPLPPDTPGSGPQAIGHYTQMIWRTTTSVGCGTASGGGHPFSILVCQYSPPGNIFGQKPY
jgi:uncharacterized protein YkwD